jgi:hypothetical protein
MSDTKEKEARERFERESEQAYHDPESVVYFVMVPERYYLGMWCLPLPEPLCRYGAKMGDLVLLVYRKLDTPENWLIKMRYRYHLGPKPDDPSSVEDKKTWSMYRVGGSEEKIIASVAHIFRMLVASGDMLAGGPVCQPPDFLELRCTGEQCLDKMMQAKKDWLHVTVPEEREKEKWYSRREAARRKEQLAREVEKSRPGAG